MTQENIQLVEEHARAIQKIIIEETEKDKSGEVNCLLFISTGDELTCIMQGSPLGVAATVASACKESQNFDHAIKLTQELLLL